MQPPHRILVVSNLYPPDAIGGAEVVAARQARALHDAGNVVSVFAGKASGSSPASGMLERKWDHDGHIPVFRNGLIKWDLGGNFIRRGVASEFLAVLAETKPDIVHFHNVIGLGANLIPVAKRYGAKVIVTLHDHWGFCFKNTLLRNDLSICDNVEECAKCTVRLPPGHEPELPIRLRRDYVAWCLGHADRLISPSPYLARAYLDSALMTRSVQVISNGIDLDRLTAVSQRAPLPSENKQHIRFLCAAYLGTHKGIGHLLGAAKRLANKSELHGRWSLTICGHGDLAPSIAKDIAKGQFGDAVELRGKVPRDELLSIMREADAVILPSIWPENEPVILLEAIGMGKAQIATRIGGNVDLVEEGKSGLLVEPAKEADLAVAMEHLIRNPNLVTTFGYRNLQRRDQFSEKTTIEKLISVYDMPAEQTVGRELIVACAGPVANLEIARIIEKLYMIESGQRRVRLIYNSWLDSEAWKSVDLLWIWPGAKIEDVEVAVRAVRARIPILAEMNSVLSGLSEMHGLPAYADLNEALSTIAALAELPPPPFIRSCPR